MDSCGVLSVLALCWSSIGTPGASNGTRRSRSDSACVDCSSSWVTADDSQAWLMGLLCAPPVIYLVGHTSSSFHILTSPYSSWRQCHLPFPPGGFSWLFHPQLTLLPSSFILFIELCNRGVIGCFLWSPESTAPSWTVFELLPVHCHQEVLYRVAMGPTQWWQDIATAPISQVGKS